MVNGYAILYIGLFSLMAHASDNSSSSVSFSPIPDEVSSGKSLIMRTDEPLTSSPISTVVYGHNFLDALDRAADGMTMTIESLIEDADKLALNLCISEREQKHQSYFSTLLWFKFYVENFNTLYHKLLDAHSHEYLWKVEVPNSEKVREVSFKSLSSFYQDLQKISMESPLSAQEGLIALAEIKDEIKRYHSKVLKMKGCNQGKGEEQGQSSLSTDQGAIMDEEIFFMD